MNHLTPGEIYTFKLVSGEEITAKIFKNTDGVFEVTQPISMVLGPQGLQMMPSLFSSNPEKNVYINTVNLSMASNPAKKGFQVTALNGANAMAGNFVAGTNTQLKTATISGGQRKYATHKNTSNTAATQAWSWTWVAPATSEGAVTFYVATNKANNNNNDNGDLIYLSQHVFLSDDASLDETTKENDFNVGYSPEKDAVLISYATLSILPTSLNLVNLEGKSVFSKKLGATAAGNNQEWVSLPSHLPNGLYVVHFFVGNKAYSAPISLQR